MYIGETNRETKKQTCYLYITIHLGVLYDRR